jgi:septum formation protein
VSQPLFHWFEVEEGCDGGVLESFPVTEKHVLVLASNSPRRRQLLALAGWPFSVSVANVDESQRPDEAPTDYVLRLAEAKARAVVGDSDQIILAADTTVVDEGVILGKPKDRAEAITMLARLRGHTHQVYSGVALLRLSDGWLLKEICVTKVPMRYYSDEEINAYVQTGDPLDKAGAYAIQHQGFRPVDMPSHEHEGLSGCYANVMGLPMCHVIQMMRKMDIQPNTDAFAGCKTLVEYRRCPVSEAILRGEM